MTGIVVKKAAYGITHRVNGERKPTIRLWTN